MARGKVVVMVSFNDRGDVFDLVLPNIKAFDRKSVLEHLARESARALGLPFHVLLNCLTDRECRSGSGIGDGVALPHVQLPFLDRSFVLFSTIASPVGDFETVDDRPVDMVCLLLSPSEDSSYHLRRLAYLSRLFRDASLRHSLRAISTADEAYAIMAAQHMLKIAA